LKDIKHVHRKHERMLFPNADGFVDQTNWKSTHL